MKHVLKTKVMRSNLRKLYIGAILQEMMFLAVIIVPFLGSFGLSMTEIIFTETIYALIIVMLEVPSGYFADIYGRKISLIIGTMSTIIGMLFYTFGNVFLIFSIGAVFWGIGRSFISGADEALLYETLIQLKKENEYKRITGNIFYYGRLASVLVAIIGGFMASKSLVLPFFASIVPYTIWLILSFSLKETKHIKKQGSETWNHFKKIFKENFLHNAKIRHFVLFSGVAGFFAIDFWFKQRYLESLGVPILYFGLILGIAPIFSGLGGKYAEKIENTIGLKYSLLLIPAVPFVIWIIMGSTKTLFIIPLMLILHFFGGLYIPIFNDFIQKLVSSDRRATIMSLMSLFRRLIFFIFAPFLGWITDIYSIQTAFLYIALIVLIFTITNIYFLKKFKII